VETLSALFAITDVENIVFLVFCQDIIIKLIIFKEENATQNVTAHFYANNANLW